MKWIAAPCQRLLAARAMASERAYSPMPKVPETGTNRIRGVSGKGGKPTVQHHQMPGSAKLGSNRTPQHAALHEAAHRLAQQLRMAPQPAVHRQAESRFSLLQVTRGQSWLHEFSHQQFTAPTLLIDQHVRIHAQHELDQAMIQQRRTDFERMR